MNINQIISFQTWVKFDKYQMKAVNTPPSRRGMGRGSIAKNSQHFNTGLDQQTNGPTDQQTDTVQESQVCHIVLAPFYRALSLFRAQL